MLFIIKPLGRWLAVRRSRDAMSFELMGLMLAIGLASAAVTDAIGIHPLFGALLAGLT